MNELFHDAENRLYETKHPEIFGEEAKRWQDFSKRWIASKPSPLAVLDYGTGTGFVAAQVVHALRPDDRLICADLSSEMLAVCRRNLESMGLNVHTDFLKLGATNVPLPTESCDFILLNSVLHHLPDLRAFFSEVDRLLKPGARLAIGHEPNAVFYRTKGLWKRYQVAQSILSPLTALRHLLLRCGGADLLLRLGAWFSASLRKQYDVFQAVNRQLLQQREVQRPLTVAEIISIVDFHSPTAGGVHLERGLDMPSLASNHMPKYSIEFYETYHFLSKITNKNVLTRWYSRKLEERYPQMGSLFFVVLKKPDADQVN